mmetsp:Transcript_7029/g.9287  ORF Transcript_7029/g.9287 Transcript_7029/m.9287 type:complete len:204 (+) Transcript_7029:35-646(+)|eukprot:CAMPEP_0184440346 /NCGR_PEP_ID=MMETSP0738-20130409/755517_1 /TAXON_ID=385413 /ORGANISM="Thalassiosira miniscula, Strain CCMP1093" /LENGTH=203 /DNA_ID=CAMNT_0026808229 /DNA_START=26 /DNA_END=637 /DNA_ORIENTATION=-
MMKTACLLALVGSAAAFAPAQQGRVNTEVCAFQDQLGAQAPLGFFDPMGMLADADQERFDRLREVELKHGRVSMLAVVGYLTTASGYRFPDFPADVPAGFGAWSALASSDDGKAILAQMGAFFVVAEIVNRDADWLDNEAEFVGDYRNGALDFGWDKFDDATKLRKRAIELNNGRAAQMGILGLMVHEKLGVSILPGNVLPGH